ncbi:MAG TPA: DUF1015 domain-containing protein [Nocardioidaceae bacterium]|nr:DUF1015 domain-containing protein [Nocardioidaceae bacterium]
MSTDRRAPLVMAPFRGLRFDPEVVGDLGSVISPPYDVLDADTVRDLEAGNPRNIVRLILSRRYERPYLAVRDRLEKWRAQGCLVPDRVPALYLYQYTVDGVTVRGVIGLVGLRQESEGVVLPHEDVMPGPVDDRAVLMRTTRTNPEPILLVHEGSTHLREILAGTTEGLPLVAFTGRDGSDHQVWALTDPRALEAVAAELAPGQALIADGHHRYAAYLRLQRELRDPSAPAGASPWDYGLAMLVDQNDYPLAIGPIHRSLSGLTLADVLDLSAENGDQVTGCTDREAALAALAGDDPERAVFVVSDGRSWVTLSTKRRHEVDAAVLHNQLFPAWNVAEQQVGYHHSLDQALHSTAQQPGVVIAVSPPKLEQVMASAARGERMPRKSTSFTPKPRMGVVLRDLRDA